MADPGRPGRRRRDPDKVVPEPPRDRADEERRSLPDETRGGPDERRSLPDETGGRPRPKPPERPRTRRFETRGAAPRGAGDRAQTGNRDRTGRSGRFHGPGGDRVFDHSNRDERDVDDPLREDRDSERSRRGDTSDRRRSAGPSGRQRREGGFERPRPKGGFERPRPKGGSERPSRDREFDRTRGRPSFDRARRESAPPREDTPRGEDRHRRSDSPSGQRLERRPWDRGPSRGPGGYRDRGPAARGEWREGPGGPDRDRPLRDFRDRPRRCDDRPRRTFDDRPRRTFDDRPRLDDEHRPPRRFDDRPRRSEDRPTRDPEWTPDRGAWPRPDVSAEAESRADLIAEGDELVAGRRPVEEAFGAGRQARRLLVVPQRRAALEALVTHATREHVPIVEVEGGTLTSLAGFDGHQGIALVVAPRRWASIDDVLARAIERGQPPFVLALDSVEDPRNLGALLRSAEAAGVHGVILPTRRAAPLTAVAVKASAGASEHLPIVPVDDLAEALGELHARGLRVIGADAAAPLSYREADLRGPIAAVIGSEGAGFAAPTRRRLDLLVRIPMHGRVESLNASVAGSLLLFEVSAQRHAATEG